VTGLWPWV